MAILDSDKNLIETLARQEIFSDEVCLQAVERFKDSDFGNALKTAAGGRVVEIVKSVNARADKLKPVNHVEKEDLILAKDGSIKNLSANYVRILSKDVFLHGKVRCSALDGRVYVSRVPWGLEEHPIRDVDLNRIRSWISENYGLDDGKKLAGAISVVADDFKFHPIVSRLNALVWDGSQRLSELFPRYLGAERSEYTTAVTTLLFTGACLRVLKPGIKFDYCPILADKQQGTGKSSLVRFMALCDDWFCDSLGDLGDLKRAYESIRGHWIIELGEMISTRKTKDVESIKAYLSRTDDDYREPYGVYSDRRPRQCVFIGTSNKPQFLPEDKTGNRRFLPIICDGTRAIKHPMNDEAETRQFVQQCFAETMALIKAGNYSLVLSSRFDDELNELREISTPEDSKIGVIQAWLESARDDDNKPIAMVCSRMIWERALNNDDREPKNYELQEIADIMNLKVEGWARYRGKDGQGKSAQYRFEKYGRQRAWFRVSVNTVNGGGVDNGADSVDNGAPEDEFLAVSDDECGIPW